MSATTYRISVLAHISDVSTVRLAQASGLVIERVRAGSTRTLTHRSAMTSATAPCTPDGADAEDLELRRIYLRQAQEAVMREIARIDRLTGRTR